MGGEMEKKAGTEEEGRRGKASRNKEQGKN